MYLYVAVVVVYCSCCLSVIVDAQWQMNNKNNKMIYMTPALPPPIDHRSMEDHYTEYFWLMDPLSIEHGSQEDHYTEQFS